MGKSLLLVSNVITSHLTCCLGIDKSQTLSCGQEKVDVAKCSVKNTLKGKETNEAYRDKFDINDYQIKLNSLKALLYISGSKYFPKCILG